jgi:hypothetical protein
MAVDSLLRGIGEDLGDGGGHEAEDEDDEGEEGGDLCSQAASFGALEFLA